MPGRRRTRPVRRSIAALALALLGGGLLPAGVAAAAPVLPAGFTQRTVASVAGPIALAFTPDGRGLLATQPGQLRVLGADGSLLAAPALDLAARACTNNDRGLLGVAVDPHFASNHWIYVVWTRMVAPSCPTNVVTGMPRNRVSRFTLGAGNLVDQSSELVVADNIPAFGPGHTAGDLHFGADGLLYVSLGDSGCQLTDPTRCGGPNANSRRLDIPIGKILRLTATGQVPPGNPYASAPGARHCTRPGTVPPGTGPCSETYASGLRNPFRFAVKPGTNTFYVNDVGQDTWEEVDRLTRGADYGWNVCEGDHDQGTTGPCSLPSATGPLFEYNHSTGCASITGGAFVPGSSFGADRAGSYLYADFVCGSIFERTAAGATRTFVTGLGTNSVVALAFGPYRGRQALYYLSYAGGGSVHRVVRT